ncbi:MAG: Ribosomal RNA-processing protein 7 [Piccolia ochrophora]|nr:MAG: Ribosomal RNA-processing protein 7 [Piccolia ochrophora]
MTTLDAPSSVNGYLVLHLKLQALPSFKESALHYLYLRRHEAKSPTPDDARTLFAVNVPIDATESHLRYLFANLCGSRVDHVDLDVNKRQSTSTTIPLVAPAEKGKRKGKRKREEVDAHADMHNGLDDQLPHVWDRVLHRSGYAALIRFVDTKSLAVALKATKNSVNRPLKWDDGLGGRIPSLGSRRYLTHHTLRYPSTAPLQATVDVFMTNYAATEARRARQAALLRQEPDDDGFVTVTRGGRTGPARQVDAQAAAEKQKQKEGLRDFYRFQLREERKKAQADLLKGFEEDRKRVDEMKRKRGRFRPE